jgi:hypothetical protein
MKFEEVLPHLREGKMVKYPNYDDGKDGYWIAGYIGIFEPCYNTLTLHRVTKEGRALRELSIKSYALMSDVWELVE